MAVKTHWDCDKPALSFALAEGGDVGGVERDGTTSAAWLTILPVVDSFLFTPDSSEGIDLDGYNIIESDLEGEGAGIFVQTLSYSLYKCGSGSAYAMIYRSSYLVPCPINCNRHNPKIIPIDRRSGLTMLLFSPQFLNVSDHGHECGVLLSRGKDGVLEAVGSNSKLAAPWEAVTRGLEGVDHSRPLQGSSSFLVGDAFLVSNKCTDEAAGRRTSDKLSHMSRCIIWTCDNVRYYFRTFRICTISVSSAGYLKTS